MTVLYTTVRSHHAGFGMYQAGPEWTTFGMEYGEFAADAPEVTEATIADWEDWVRDFGTWEKDTDTLNAIDGNVYEQNGGTLYHVTPNDSDDGTIYCVREV